MSAFKKSDAPDDNQPDAGTSGPVFADPSGRRQRWVRRAAMAVTVPLIGYLAFVTVSLVARPGLLPVLIPGAAPARSMHALSHEEKTAQRTAPAPKAAARRPDAGLISSAQASESLDPVANTSAAPTTPPTDTRPPTTTVAPPTTSSPPIASPPARHSQTPTPTVDPTASPTPRCHDWPRHEPDSATSSWQRHHRTPPDRRFRPPRRHCAAGATSP